MSHNPVKVNNKFPNQLWLSTVTPNDSTVSPKLELVSVFIVFIFSNPTFAICHPKK